MVSRFFQRFWCDFYSTNKDILNLSHQISQIILGSNNYLISSSLFSNSNIYTGSGSAIYLISSEIVQILIEESIFYNCSSTVNGGAIYISDLSCECVFYKITGISCSTTLSTGFGTFCYSQTSKSNTAIHYIFLCCGISCGTSEKGYGIFSLFNGNLTIISYNCSKSLGRDQPGLRCELSDLSTNPALSSQSFCQFENNIASNQDTSHYRGISIHSYSLKYHNFINNSCLGTGKQNIRVYISSLIITNSSFILFDPSLIVFAIEGTAIITSNNCYFSPTPNNLGSITIQNSINSLFIQKISYISFIPCKTSQICKSRCQNHQLFLINRFISFTCIFFLSH
jgi:hypothetical protein